MEIKSKFDHFNINVTNLERSIAFYEKALGLKEHHRKESSDGSFTIRKTDGYASKTLQWDCTLSMTRMTIGLRYCRRNDILHH